MPDGKERFKVNPAGKHIYELRQKFHGFVLGVWLVPSRRHGYKIDTSVWAGFA